MADPTQTEPDDDIDDTDDENEGAIPTSDQDDDTDTDEQDEQGTGAGATGAGGPVPGAAQSQGPAPSELLALVRAVHQYGMRQAQGGDQGGQSMSFEDGGSVPAGALPTSDDDNENVNPTPQPTDQQQPVAQQQPQPAMPTTPTEDALNTREHALDKSGLGGAFGAAQHQKIDQARQAYQSGQGGNTTTAGGEHDFSGSPEPPQAQQTPSGFVPPHQAIRDQIQRSMEGLKRFIAGDKAVDGNTAAAIGYAVDPQGNLPPVEKKMKMVQYAYDKGMQTEGDPRTGMNLALGTLQHQRKEYDMWRTAAAVKLDQQDTTSALDAANKAFQAPFGDNVHFAQSSTGGITATVTDDKGTVQGTFDMAPDQFSMLLHKHGKFDNLVQQGVLGTLSQMSGPMGEPQGPQQPFGPQQPQGPQQPRKRSDEEIDQEFAKPNAGNLTDEEVRQHDERHFPIMRAPEGVDRKLFDQSNQMFPMVSQNAQRTAWIAQQQEQQAGRESKEKIANRTAEGRLALAKSNQEASMQRAQERDNASMQRTQLREGEHNARSDRYWAERAREFVIREAGKARNNPNSAKQLAIVKDALSQHENDQEGFRKALEEKGLNYERDILGTGAQQAPTANAQGAATQGAGGAGNTSATGAAKAPPRVGEVRNGYRFLGGNPADKAAWIQQ